ncbi:gliding motility protein GldM [Flavobacteriaceae bacterium S356]|uniref:Gliding motility protein GldM n=1 Tax=Asprobacillus argus TaxID=3076534 RepID=A0ABU3LH14_9FLAO|nr:gliding motility protein GldM [Flavobacteriaceae bacterium S356]
MAGGKLSPRQKMINLMYLIFIAMLAMQMDKKVLSSFGFMKEKIEDANRSNNVNIDHILSSLNTKASDQPEKFADLNTKAQQIHTLSDGLFQYMEALKDSLLLDTAEEDKKNYESMSNGDRLDEMFFKGDKFTPEGERFVKEINDYRTQVLAILGSGASQDLITNINKRFNTDPESAREEGSPDIPWLKSRYEGMPMITSLANMTQIQGDVKNTEAEIYTSLLGGQLESEVSLTNYEGIVRLDKTAYFAGERVTGQVVLGRYDATLVPTKVTLGNRDITNNVQNGQVMLDMPAGNIGERTIKGTITFMQDNKEVPVDFTSKYSVIAQPDEAVISADKMNVVYRGLDNPISISLPGVGDKDITANATGLRKTGVGKYIMRPSNTQNEVEIVVNGKISPTKTVTSRKKFRIKDIPAAMGTVRGDFGVVRMPKSSLGNTPIGAGLPDFVFDLQLDVQGFTVKVPGQLAVKVTGTKLNARAKAALAKARRGDVITIFDIKATIRGNSSYQLKRVLPVSIEITN